MVCKEYIELGKKLGDVTAIFIREQDAKRFNEEEKDMGFKVKKVNIAGIDFFGVFAEDKYEKKNTN